MKQNRTRIGVTVSAVGLVCNLLLFVLKLLAGLWAGAISVTADALNNLSDASGSIVAFVGFRLSAKPADAKHPYGHARFEYIAGMLVAALTLAVGFEVAKSSVEKIVTPTSPTVSAFTVAVLTVSVVIKTGMFLLNHILGKRMDSPVLKATAADSRNDALITLSVLAAMAIEAIWGLAADGWIGLSVAVFILYSGVRLVLDTVHPLLGTAGTAEMRQALTEVLSREERVLGLHDLLIHDYGPSHCYASVHVELDQCEDAMFGHELIDRLERECLESLGVHLVIHHDPVVTQDPLQARLCERVRGVLRCFDEGLSMHDLRVDGHAVRFDVSLPDRLRARTAEIESFVRQALTDTPDGAFDVTVVFDPEEWA